MRTSRIRFAMFFALAIFAFGLYSIGDWSSAKWALLGIGAYGIPLAAQLARSPVVRAYGLWFGILLIAQTLATPYFVGNDLITLEPNLSRRVNVVGDVLPGISGPRTVTTDDHGFRVTKQIDYANKPDGTFRVFAIGGSTTEQILLDDHETWTHLLQESLSGNRQFKDVEVINTGVSGVRAEHHLATLEYISQFSPDLVIFLVGLNDWNRHIHLEFGGGESTVIPEFRDTLVGLAAERMWALATSDAQPEAPPGLQVEEFNGEYYSSQNDSLTRSPVYQFHPEKVLDDYAQTLAKISDTCDAFGISCLFATQPTAYQSLADDRIKRLFWMTPPNRDYTLTFDSMVDIANLYNDYLLSFARSNGHETCDVATGVPPTTEFFYDDCHYNAGGAAEVARLLNSCLSVPGAAP